MAAISVAGKTRLTTEKSFTSKEKLEQQLYKLPSRLPLMTPAEIIVSSAFDGPVGLLNFGRGRAF